MQSRRLPGKVLREIRGKQLLERLLERLSHASGLDFLLIATSDQEADDPIAEFAAHHDVTCHRGPEEDVARRFRDASREHGLDGFVRVNGDSPLLDHRLVDRAVKMFETGEFDVVTNVMPRTFPRGQSVEVVDTGLFHRIYDQLHDPEDLENVTPFIYRHQDRFRIGTFRSETPYDDVRMVVDTERDLQRIEAMLDRMDRPQSEYGVDELVSLYREVAR
jgi:spore coat polysaccharide biosynthesis protein SpsF